MARIRIIAIPLGRAPESVRKAWVGAEMETIPASGKRLIGAGSGEPEKIDGYVVVADVAIQALWDKNELSDYAASGWLMGCWDVTPEAHLVFAKNVCQEL